MAYIFLGITEAFNNLFTENKRFVMTEQERNMIRRQIGNEISELEKSINTLTELISGEVQSVAKDRFTSKENNPSKEINGMALEKAKQKIVILRKLLQRVDSPDYGICVNRGKPIPFGRIKAVPTATRCLSCI
jgi:DnaK suppressor protein